MLCPEPRVAVGAGVSGYGCGRQQLMSARGRGRRGGKEGWGVCCDALTGRKYLELELAVCKELRPDAPCLAGSGCGLVWRSVYLYLCAVACAVRAEGRLMRRARVGGASMQSVRAYGVCTSRRGVCMYFYKASHSANTSLSLGMRYGEVSQVWERGISLSLSLSLSFSLSLSLSKARCFDAPRRPTPFAATSMQSVTERASAGGVGRGARGAGGWEVLRSAAISIFSQKAPAQPPQVAGVK